MAIKSRRQWLRTAAVVVTLAGSGVSTDAQSEWRPRLLYFRNAAVHSAVTRAILGAARRLQEPECQKLLGDFTDGKGVPLATVLEQKQVTLARFLTDLRFVDASDTRRCGRRTSAAFTEPGSLAILVCGDQFYDRAGSLQGATGEIVMVHEVLHALGLPENGRFPTSAQITAAVRKRCEGQK